MKWKKFTYQDSNYDLSHLHPVEWVCVQPAVKGKPERRYKFLVEFGLHCFSRGMDGNEELDPSLIYSDSREERLFDFDRYELSKALPGIVCSLDTRKCFHTHHGNFFTIERTNKEGLLQRYEIYFTVSRSSKRGWMNLFIQSAYIRDHAHNTPPKKKPPIKFYVIAFNTLHKKPIKAPA